MGDELFTCRQTAIRYIGIANKSSGRVTEYLLSKGFSPEAADLTVQALYDDGYIDDGRVARRFLRKYSGSHAEGKRLLLRRILDAGVRSEVAQENLEDFDEQAALRDCVRYKLLPEFEKASSSEDFDMYRWTQKALRTLANRGFSISQSIEALRSTFRDVE